MSSVGSLEDEARKRKLRLMAMRAKKEGKADDSTTATAEDEALPKPVFRSYRPIDDNLKENAIPDPKTVDVSDRVTEQLESGKPEPIIEEVELSALAPRKPDWDLKRDVSKKLEKLERRTQRAVAELIRERLQNEKIADGTSLARAVSGADHQKEVEDDDD